MSELERIERRLIEVEALFRASLQVQAEVLKVQDRILSLLEPSTTYPASCGGSVSVK